MSGIVKHAGKGLSVSERTSVREHILTAAQQLVARDGVKKLTIDGVAAAAKLSRGGVLYHFPSKDALIDGMVRRLVASFQQSLDATIADDPDPRGRFTRAYARLTLLPDESTLQEVGAVIYALIAGLAYNPRLLDPLRETLLDWQRQSEAELDPTTAAIVRLTTHAIWTNDLLLPNDLSPQLRRDLVARLEAMTRG